MGASAEGFSATGAYASWAKAVVVPQSRTAVNDKAVMTFRFIISNLLLLSHFFMFCFRCFLFCLTEEKKKGFIKKVFFQKNKKNLLALPTGQKSG